MKIKVKDLEITLMKTEINNENLSAYEMERLIDSIK